MKCSRQIYSNKKGEKKETLLKEKTKETLMARYHEEHGHTLDKILHDLTLINEDPTKVEWVMREGDLYRAGIPEQAPLCDLLIGYKDKEGLCIEAKRSRNRRDKAIEQLNHGFYLLDKMGYEPIRRKILYYRGDRLYHEVIYEPVYRLDL